jgi:hypothetical protein
MRSPYAARGQCIATCGEVLAHPRHEAEHAFFLEQSHREAGVCHERPLGRKALACFADCAPHQVLLALLTRPLPQERTKEQARKQLALLAVDLRISTAACADGTGRPYQGKQTTAISALLDSEKFTGVVFCHTASHDAGRSRTSDRRL